VSRSEYGTVKSKLSLSFERGSNPRLAGSLSRV
jgi:hypothetical protein